MFHRLAQPPVAVLDAFRHLAHGIAQQLEFGGRVGQVGTDGVMAAAIGDGDAAQIGDPLRHLAVGGEPDRDPGEQPIISDRQQEIDADMQIGVAEQPLFAASAKATKIVLPRSATLPKRQARPPDSASQ